MMKSGFRLIATQTVAELASKAHTYEHEQSGARLVYLENDDDNKVFSITFKTPPADHTGVPHILEHSVLCGSRKFPLSFRVQNPSNCKAFRRIRRIRNPLHQRARAAWVSARCRFRLKTKW